MMMKSLKSIFPFLFFLSVSTKNKRANVSKVNTFFASEMLLLCSEFFWIQTKNPQDFSLCSAFYQEQSDERRKNKNEEIIPHRRRSRRLRRRRCRPTASSLSFLSAVSAVPTFVSPDRFWTRFDATDATTSFSLFFSRWRVRVRFDSNFKNDRWDESAL